MPPKGSSTFRYPGAKVTIAPWIIDHFPQHVGYVEPFGGSGAIFMQKEPSKVEVFNDLDSEIVEFFDVVRESGDELAEWLSAVPYSREKFEQWVADYRDGLQPEDPVKRVGRIFALRYMCYGGRLDSPSFGTEAVVGNRLRGKAITFKRASENIDAVRDRFKDVIIENEDYSEILKRYDRDTTLFYCDPPYVGTDCYKEGVGFDHEAFIDDIEEIDGRVIVSYDDLPDVLDTDEYVIVSRDREWTFKSSSTPGTEKLVMNFDPDDVAQFSSPGQSTLSEVIE